MATNDKVDLAIVGAGASGATFAAVLAQAGKKVVLIEQGPDWQLADLISSAICSSLRNSVIITTRHLWRMARLK